MSFQRTAIWVIYMLVLAGFILRKTFNFLAPQTAVHEYFQILIFFDFAFLPVYFAYFFQVLLNLIHFIVIILYLKRIVLFKPVFWQVLFALRIVFDIIGHSYEMNILVGLYHASPKICLLVLIQSVATYIPSYIACFRYAFHQDKMLEKDNR